MRQLIMNIPNIHKIYLSSSQFVTWRYKFGLRTFKSRAFFARNDDLDIIRDRSEFVMINNFTKNDVSRW